MNVLITSAASRLAQSLADSLNKDHPIRLTERVFVTSEHEFVQSALGHDAGTNLLVRGMDAIVHVAEPLPTDDESQQLDYLTRCTYNLLWAAAEESVPHAIFLSTLHLLTHYEENLWVQEHWRPRPTAEPHTLGKLLGESVCREFAREHKLRITVLRLGEVVRADEVAGEPFSPLWVDERDVAHAVACVLATDTGVWSIFHIQPDSPQARYVINNAKEHLDYEPQFNFDEIKAPPSHPLTSR